MNTAPDLARLLEAVRGLFTDHTGAAVPVHIKDLDSDHAEAVLGTTAEVMITPPAGADAALAGQPVSGAVVVRTGGQACLVYSTDPLGPTSTALLAGIAGLSQTVHALRAEAGLVDALHTTGRALTAQLDLDRVVQDATDAALTATGAQFGAFFYNLVNEYGESYTLHTISGVPREKFSQFPMPRNTAVFAPTFDGRGTVRSPDITADDRFGHNTPYHGMPQGHLPVRSYLAVSVISPSSSEVLGGFFFGHPETDRFTARHEYLAEGIAGYAAIALDNARLFDRERNLATELARSMVPEVPAVEGMDIVARYLPAATGTKIGGDWYDVISLPSGATAFVIGDVVGHGVAAATIMGQIRTAIRSYALLDLAPSDVLERVSRLCATWFGVNFATCLYAVHQPGTDELVIANAGHLPAVIISPDGGITQVGEAIAQPLGVGGEFPERHTPFPPGATLVLYTDGLVETRNRDLTEGIDNLLEAYPQSGPTPPRPRPSTS